jgi:hypothetical protein
MLKPDKVGVHVTHCCYQHGCKYGWMTKDPCPVAEGRIKQESGCEYCYDQWESNGSPECAAAGCKKPGYWTWTGKAGGSMLAMVVVKVFFYFCDGHDEWHRKETNHYFHAKPVEKRIL